MTAPSYEMADPRRVTVSKYNERMANRMARRAKLDEPAVAVAFAFNNLFTTVVLGIVEDVVRFIPTFGDLLDAVISLLAFYFHRIVLVTSTRVYVYRDLPFHRPGKLLASYDRGPGVVRLGSDRTGWWSRVIRRGQLTFQDGTVVYHGIFWIKRAQYVAQEANVPTGQAPGQAVGTPAPGWYPDPSGNGGRRWWDGSTWTDQVHAG